MRQALSSSPRTLTLPVALAAAMCLCAAARVEARSALRPVTVESRALANLVTRIAEAARHAQRSIAVQPHPTHAPEAGRLQVAQPHTDHRLTHLPPLREALHNLPPPARV